MRLLQGLGLVGAVLCWGVSVPAFAEEPVRPPIVGDAAPPPLVVGPTNAPPPVEIFTIGDPNSSKPKLVPNAQLRLRRSFRWSTLADAVAGRHRDAEMAAILPANYSPERKHPLFVYLKGGAGGPDDGGRMAREIVGSDDFIAVYLPLFKKDQPPGKTLPVRPEDFSLVSESFRELLVGLESLVPNIDRDRSVIGGHSNGAHTLDVLLTGKDPFVGERFRSFWLHEGGFGLMEIDAWRPKNARFLFLVGDGGTGDGPAPPRAELIDKFLADQKAARADGTDFKFVVMRGYGHDVPPEYMRNVRQFARHEPLEDVAATDKALAARLTLPLRAHPDSSQWNDLFVSDLTNAVAEGGGWKYHGESLRAEKPTILVTKAVHGDCVLDFEYRADPPNPQAAFYDGGSRRGAVLLLESSATKDRPIEIALADDPEQPLGQSLSSVERSGAWRGIKKPVAYVARPSGEWNRVTIVVQSPRVVVWMNDSLVNEIDLASEWPADPNAAPDGEANRPPKRGKIGLRGRHIGLGVEFRNLKLLRL